MQNVQGMRSMTLEPDWSFHMRFQIPRSEKGKHMYDWRSIVHTARDLPAVWLTQGKSNMLYISTPINGNDGYVIEPPKPIKFGKWQTLQIGRERVMVCAVFFCTKLDHLWPTGWQKHKVPRLCFNEREEAQSQFR